MYSIWESFFIEVISSGSRDSMNSQNATHEKTVGQIIKRDCVSLTISMRDKQKNAVGELKIKIV